MPKPAVALAHLLTSMRDTKGGSPPLYLFAEILTVPILSPS